MAAYIGKIEAFDETIEPHGLRMLKANKVDDSLKVASLLSLIGGKTYNLLRTLTSPTKPAEKSPDVRLLQTTFLILTKYNCNI
jgi:hypothetical protein